MKDESPAQAGVLRGHGRRHRRACDACDCGGARTALAGSRGALHRDEEGSGSQTRAARRISDRVDRNRRLKSRRFPAKSGDAGGTAVQRVDGRPHAGSRPSRGGFFHRGFRGRSCFAGGAVETYTRGRDGAERDSRIHASQARPLRGARSGQFPGDGEMVSRGRGRSDGDARAGRLLCDTGEASWRRIDGF